MSLPAVQEKSWPEVVARPRPLHRGAPSWLTTAARDVFPASLGIGLALAFWEAWVRLNHVKEYLVPAPSRVAERLYERPEFFAKQGLLTLEDAMVGFALGAGVAIVLASLMSQSRFIERAVFPLAILLKVTPIVVIAPFLTIWFGFGVVPKIFIAAIIVFFPVMVNALVGFRSVNPNALALMQSLAASRWEVFRKLRVPSSLPYLFAAFKVSIPLSVIGAVVAEWFGGDRGLGSVIFKANSNLDMRQVFAGVFTLALIGVGLYLLTSLIERRVLFWHESTVESR